MKKRLQKTICYILLFTGFGFLYYKWCQGTGDYEEKSVN